MIYKYENLYGEQFILSRLSESLIKWIEKNKTEPTEIAFEPKYFIEFLQLTSQFINSPTFLGIPVRVDYGDQGFSKPSAPAVTKRRKKTTDK